ncbi:hypothetical protein OKA05_06480 [Luteolibacter arcticus]|uniref:Uncharacterized protein n=1 Tax=Luteolibacter arcticus TaxID=1581411 RepID=A0ABT3GFF4_9BACT|nr:hypothetical protein [Luteolibacter arcticus]MCW1922191.1 hypothetical protein [Luteolibacter arcticus]
MTIPVRDEEYPILAFAMHWMIEKGIASFSCLHRPQRCWLEERPAIGEGKGDLILWWHRSRVAFPDFDEMARIDLIQRSKENALFTRGEMARFKEVPTTIGFPAAEGAVAVESDWWFHASRVGIAPSSRQAVLHLVAVPCANHWLNFGYLLLIGWHEDGILRVNHEKPTTRFGK